MTHHEIIDLLSRCGLGAFLLGPDGLILEYNDTAARLLALDRDCRGVLLRTIAPFLVENQSGNPRFNTYLEPLPAPTGLPLPLGMSLCVFRDATADFHSRILAQAINHVSDAITFWDDQGRLLALNDSAVRQESFVPREVLGHHIDDLYRNNIEGSSWAATRVIEQGQPIRDLRQDFVTDAGKHLQIVTSSYPLIDRDRIVGAVSMMNDFTKLENLQKHVISLQSALLRQNKEKKPQKQSALSARYHFNDIAYSGQTMRTVVERCKQFARSDTAVMIYGETGTGKELFAQSIHNESARSSGPFLAINCAAIPETLLESMFFGTEKGAYTGSEKREGLFELADGGTLFLDEINSMDIGLQSKLLRVLQEGNFRRVGGSKQIDVNVRVLSAINVPPLKAIEENKLRSDLYFRLGVINVTVPPLRDRTEDIPLLARNFIMNCNEKLGKNVSELSAETLEIFRRYHWMGNVRELQHAIEYAMHIVPPDKTLITPDCIPEHILEAGGSRMQTQTVQPAEAVSVPAFTPNGPTMDEVMEEAGRRYLQSALRENDGNITQTARMLGITRQNLQHRMKKLGIKPQD